MPALDQHHAQVQHHGHDGQKIDYAGKRDQPVAKIGELLADGKALKRRCQRLAEKHFGRRGENQRHVEQNAQDIANG